MKLVRKKVQLINIPIMEGLISHILDKSNSNKVSD